MSFAISSLLFARLLRMSLSIVPLIFEQFFTVSRVKASLRFSILFPVSLVPEPTYFQAATYPFLFGSCLLAWACHA